MNLRTLAWRSLQRHWRLHLGVLLGAVLGSAILIGALIVGDSVRGSLRDGGLRRLGPFHLALSSGDRFYRAELFSSLEPNHTLAGHLPANSPIAPGRLELTTPHASLLQLSGAISRQDRSARVNHVEVFGLPATAIFRRSSDVDGAAESQDPLAEAVWEARTQPPVGRMLLNEELAGRLHAKPGDEMVLRLPKPSALSRDAVITPREDASIALRLVVHAIIRGDEGGDLSLRSSQIPPANAFVRREDLDAALGLEGRANLTLMPPWRLRETPSFLVRARQWIEDLVRGRASSAGLALEPGSTWAPGSTQAAMLNGALGHLWELADAELELRNPPVEAGGSIELITRRIFLDDAVLEAATTPMRTNRWRPGFALPDPGLVAGGAPILTYFVNEIRTGTNATPYSMVTAAPSPWVPADLADDEIVINEWLAADLLAQPGSVLDLSYYLLDTGSQLVERTNRFRVRSVVPIRGLHADRTLMPEFPGLSKAESTRDWDAGFPLTHSIRKQDESYWKQYRGTPKAFVSLRSGQKMWANRFGRATAIRYVAPPAVALAAMRDLLESTILSNLDPAAAGLRFEPVREQALLAAEQSQDFGGLFIGFSFFLILSALVLMSMLFQFGAEEREQEVGVLLALGFTPRRVRRLFFREAVILASLGSTLGLLGALGYSRAMLWGLGTLWKDAIGTSSLQFHATPLTLVAGWTGAVVVCSASMGWALRKRGRRPPRELLQRSPEAAAAIHLTWRRRVAPMIAGLTLGFALGLSAWSLSSADSNRAGAFFGVGGLLLVGGLAAMSAWLGCVARRTHAPVFARSAFLFRAMARKRSRTLASAGLLASGSFLVFAIGANRLDSSRHPERRSSGTGGFALVAESSLPLVRDLNARSGQEALGLDPVALKEMSVVPFRVRAGDDSSCLNLNRAQQPRLLGVRSELLASRAAFQFAGAASGLDVSLGWKLLFPPALGGSAGTVDAPIPAIGDAASIEWALGRKLGDLLTFVDERGKDFQVRLVAGLANSVLQGQLVIDEREFVKRFPSSAGAQWFLIDCPPASAEAASVHLSKALQDYGFESEPAADRLARFNAIQNTYLNTFQMLGGLGLVLGSLGLGVVLLRNALERRGELATQLALG
ncbi:MAG: FtsX-like permease family protein, partial [Verrucomicrobia bacterium]|nr:FtsX-like permease family protein [Verrucomicrobiota bacterium]